jgi:hypothetical protein
MKVSAGDLSVHDIVNWIAADFTAKPGVRSIRRGRVDTGTFGPKQTVVITTANGQRFRADLCEMFEGDVH